MSTPSALQQNENSIASLPSRLGGPQIIALVLLLVFFAQCIWFTARIPLSAMEGVYVEAGLLHLERLANANTQQHSALVPLIVGVTARVSGVEKHVDEFNNYRMIMRLPFVMIGVLLGASLWYVARRLYGNTGGYVALVLYAFSPQAIGSASQIGPSIVGAWGGFGLIFTGIAVAHTLYAPREVVLWNWRRILLMGLSIAICVGAQYSFWVLLLPAFLFMLWVGWVRPGAVVVIFAAACVVGMLLLWGLYGFHPALFAQALRQANWLEVSSRDYFAPGLSWLGSTLFQENGLGWPIVLAVTLVTFIVWKKTRFFGTAAPLIVAALLLSLSVGMHFSATFFLFLGLPFLMLFIAGVSADLLESRYALVFNAVIFGSLIANTMIDVYWLANLTSRTH
jgi:hypothetical protein